MDPRTSLRAFSLIELMVVVVVILILIAILMPALRVMRWRAYDSNTVRQMEQIGQAAVMYQLSYGDLPGWFSDRELADGPEELTQNESATLSLLGLISADPGYWPAGYDNPQNLSIAVDQVGRGPVSRPGGTGSFQNGAFLSVTENQIRAVTGTVGSDNAVPELIDASTGLPFLIFRAQTGLDGSVWMDDDRKGLYLRNTNLDYLEAGGLTGALGDNTDQKSQSLLSAEAAGSSAQANRNGAVLLRETHAVAKGWVLVSPGCDSIYFSRSQNQGPDPRAVAGRERAGDFDDLIRGFGSR
ncbi:MAG: prepilin-type N-terminal cleavage/methylation domain-containing protein [Phycisphaeraceae bacterium]|nr:prepilin-type N-terminal cleavage/methylation domain-containing protein [Phycisphaeraceae bacterium]